MRHVPYLLLATLWVAACGGSSDAVTGAKPEPREETPRLWIEGTVEKGPFVDGTVAIAPAGGGTPVATDVQDALGRYAAWVPAAPVYRLEATGRAYRETAGAVGVSSLVLRALHVAGGERETVRVNVLTHLAHDRAARLAAEGTPWAEAIARAGAEVRAALGVGVPFFTPSRPADALAMLGADDGDHAYALAVAAVVDRAAGDGDLGAFLDALAADLADDGALPTEIAERLATARRELDAERVAAALRAWLDRNGHATVIVPDLRRILDSDGDGTPDREETLVVEPSRVLILRHGFDRADDVAGAAGAIADGCPPWTVDVFDGADAAAAIASGPVAADGSFSLPFGTPWSSRPALWLEAADACGARTARAEVASGVDTTPPSIDAAAFAIVRRGSGAPDAVRADAGAVEEPTLVWIASAEEGGRIGHAVPGPYGGFDEVPVGGADASYPRLWVEAADKAGNLSARVEVAAGSAPDLPTVQPAAVTVIRAGMGARDQVFGGPGALGGTCRPVEVRIEGTEGLLATAPVLDLGDFAGTEFGDVSSTPARIWLRPVDKCGRAGDAVELEAARDLDPPAIDPTRVVLLSSRAGNAAAGLSGAMVDGSGVASARLFESDCGAVVRSVASIGADGSFVAGELTGFTSSEASICVEATDKAGNVSPKVKSRRVRATLDAQSEAFGGRPEIALFSNEFDVDPRSVSPGYGAWLSSRLGEVGRGELVHGYGLETFASSVRLDVPQTWRWIDLAAPAPDVAAVRDVAHANVLAVRTMSDWPYLVTVERSCPSLYSCDQAWNWSVVDPFGPSRREGMTVAYHPTSGVLAFGGLVGGVPVAESWGWGGTGWYSYPSAGGPLATFSRMVYDVARNRLLLVAAAEGDPSLQVWEFVSYGWMRVAAAGPSFRTGFGLAADPVRGNVVLFGGKTATGAPLGDTWILNATGWTAPVLGSSPSPRWGHGMAFWNERGLVYLRGGSAAGALDSWSWDGLRWSHVDSDGRDNGVGVAMAADPLFDRLFTFHASTPAGAGAPVFTIRADRPGEPALDETLAPVPGTTPSIAWNPYVGAATLVGPDSAWRWVDGLWRPASDDDCPDAGAGARTVLVDTIRGQRLGLGRNEDGRGWSLDELGNRVVFDLPAWPPGATPVYVYDPVQARTVGVGGSESWATGAIDFNTWQATWVPLSGAPAGPVELVFDPGRGRTVAYDGASTWELDGDAWVFTASAPAACPGGKLLFDPVAGKLLKLAGAGCSRECLYDGTWSCGAFQEPGPDLAGAADPPSGTLLAQGGSKTWIREGASRHQRFPAVSVSIGLPAGATPLAASVDLTAGGRGWDASGVNVPGVEVLAWDGSQSRWATLATTSAGYNASFRFQAALPADPTPFARRGRLWFQAVPLGGSSLGTYTDAALSLRYLQVEVEYLLP